MIHVHHWILGIVFGLLLSHQVPGADLNPTGGGAKEALAAKKVRIVILIGGHGFDQIAFDKFWRSFGDFACTAWKGSPYSAFDDINQFKYDVILMYNLSSGITERQKQNFLKLLERGVGLVVWHHALANCQDWPEFEKIAGAKFWLQAGERDGVKTPASGTGWGKVKSHIEDLNHPISRGLADFVVEDEPYNRQTFHQDIHVLVTTDFPASDKTLAWVHQYGQARVFGYQSGHDARVWTNESFKRLMGRGIRWTAGRLPEKE
jgi:type 1 glutamine amidotransferase